jgi:hypothetical protein
MPGQAKSSGAGDKQRQDTGGEERIWKDGL